MIKKRGLGGGCRPLFPVVLRLVVVIHHNSMNHVAWSTRHLFRPINFRVQHELFCLQARLQKQSLRKRDRAKVKNCHWKAHFGAECSFLQNPKKQSNFSLGRTNDGNPNASDKKLGATPPRGREIAGSIAGPTNPAADAGCHRRIGVGSNPR